MKKFSKILFVASLLCVFSFTACSFKKDINSSDNSSSSEIENKLPESISTDEGQLIINENKGNPNFVLLDVRTQGEVDEFYIEGSIHRPLLDQNEFIASLEDISKDKRILIYCRTQNRSSTAYLYMKEAGYTNVQYMDGGITKWAKEGKPLIEPFKDDKTSIIIKEYVPHYYLASENLKMNINAYNEKSIEEYVPLYKKDIEVEIKDSLDKVVLKDNIKTGGNGDACIDISLDQFSIGAYNMQIKMVDKDYFSLPTFFKFQVVEQKTEEKVLTYDSLNKEGMFSDLLNVNSEYNDSFLRHNILKNISGFNLETFNGEKIKIKDQLNNKPTLLIFGSPTCGACMDCWEYMSKLDTKDFNVLYILTSLNENEIDSTKQDILNILKDKNINISTEDIYLDSVDYIWRKVLKFKTTPQVVMLNSNDEIINFLSNENKNFVSLKAFNESLNKVLAKTYNKTLLEKEDNITITLSVDNEDTIYTIKKGTSLKNIANPNKPMYIFKGWRLQDELIDVNKYIFEKDEVVLAEFERIGILTSELKNYDYQLVDLRPLEKFNTNHLDGAINIPYEDFKNDFVSKNIDKNKTVIVYGVIELNDIIDFIRSKGYDAFYLHDYKETESVEMTYEERKAKGELDAYFEYRDKEKNNLKDHYGDNYLNLTFKDYNKNVVTLKDKLVHPNEPTIIMIGSTTCGACKQPWNEFLSIKDTFKYNFIESVAFSGEVDKVIDNELAKLREDEIEDNKKYKVFDINYYYGAGDHPLFASETPIFYVLDKDGNLTNVMSGFSKAIDCVENLNGSISVKEKTPEVTGIVNKKIEERQENGEFKLIETNEQLFNMVKKSYGKFVLKESFYDYTHNVRSISGFMRVNDYSFNNPTVIYVMNSKNNDFESSILSLDNMISSSNNTYNFLIIVDNNSYKQNDLILKSYAQKIMLDDYNTIVSKNFVLLDTSYFVIIDSSGNVTNAFLEYKDLEKIVGYTKNTKSVLSPNKFTSPSIIKKGDETINKETAFNNGWISHLDSTKDNARYEYLNVNFGRNYNDLEIIDRNENKVKLSSIVDNKRPTIVCFLQDYQDDFYYNFTPLLKVKDSANIVIVFTNRKDTPYNQEYVNKIIDLAEEKAVEKAKEKQNYDYFKNIVSSNNPSLTGKELEKATDEYIVSVYNYDNVKPYIYGSYAYLTTPILETEVRGIQLYLDRNGNLSNISQTYYSVGNTFKGVLEKIGNKIAIEEN